MTGMSSSQHERRDMKRPGISVPFCLIILLLLTQLISLAFTSYAAGNEEMRLAIFQFRDTQCADPHKAGDLGIAIRNKLERYYRDHLPDIPIKSKEVVTEILDQKGLDELGIINADFLAELGDIESFTHFWSGTYARRGLTIDVEAQLWSLESASMVSVAHVELPWFDPTWYNAVEALVCNLFRDIYFRTVGEELEKKCPIIIPLFELRGSAHAALASIRMGAVNNIIREAVELHGITMKELRWAPELDVRVGFALVPEFEILGDIKYMQATSNAGGSANVTLDVSSITFLTGLAYHWKPPPFPDVTMIVEAKAGWSTGNLEKRDQFGKLDCPARIATDGVAFEISVSLSMPLSWMPAWSMQGVVGFRSMGLPATSGGKVRTLDFSGFNLGIALTCSFGGRI